MNSKRKGNAGEIELLRIFKRHGLQARRNLQQFVGGKNNPDIALDVHGILYHVEVKRTERLRLYEAMRQAARDADGRAVPIIAHRRSREPWSVTMLLEDWLSMNQ